MSVWFDAAAGIVTVEELRNPSGMSVFACSALAQSGGGHMERAAFADWFEPPVHGLAWWADPWETDADQEARRLALCFMHWIELSERAK